MDWQEWLVWVAGGLITSAVAILTWELLRGWRGCA